MGIYRTCFDVDGRQQRAFIDRWGRTTCLQQRSFSANLLHAKRLWVYI